MALFQQMVDQVVLARPSGSILTRPNPRANTSIAKTMCDSKLGQLQSSDDQKPTLPKLHLLTLSLEVRRMIYSAVVSDIELHPCFQPHSEHHQHEPQVEGHPCLPRHIADIDAGCRIYPGNSKFLVHLIGYSRADDSVGKLAKDWHIRPALVCRQLRNEWFDFLGEAPFRNLAVDAFCLPFFISHPTTTTAGKSSWLRRQILKCTQLHLVMGESYAEILHHEQNPRERKARRRVGTSSCLLMSATLLAIREMKSLQRTTLTLNEVCLMSHTYEGGTQPGFVDEIYQLLARATRVLPVGDQINIVVRVLEIVDGGVPYRMWLTAERRVSPQRLLLSLFSRLTGEETPDCRRMVDVELQEYDPDVDVEDLGEVDDTTTIPVVVFRSFWAL